MRVSNVTVRKRITIVLLIGIFVFFIIDMRLGYVQLLLGEGLNRKGKRIYGAVIFRLNQTGVKLLIEMELH